MMHLGAHILVGPRPGIDNAVAEHLSASGNGPVEADATQESSSTEGSGQGTGEAISFAALAARNDDGQDPLRVSPGEISPENPAGNRQFAQSTPITVCLQDALKRTHELLVVVPWPMRHRAL